MTIMHVLVLAWIAFLWLVLAGIIAWLAKSTGRSAILWFFIGLVLTPFAVLLFRDRA